MQKYEETHQFVISRECERKKKKSVKQCSNWWSKNAENGRAEMKATG